MKIAVVSNDGRSISAHFGRARSFVVATVAEGKVTQREMRDKDQCAHGHHKHGDGHDHHDHDHTQEGETLSGGQIGVGGASIPAAAQQDPHQQAVAAIADCDVVLSRGMGQGMFRNLRRANIRPVLTTIVEVDEAIAAFLEGRLEEHPDLVH
jgi:predicted Fe-Mo cluster-binding NifX family protein